MNLEAQDILTDEAAERLRAAEVKFEKAVIIGDEPLPPAGAFADGPRPQRRFNARTRRHELVPRDPRKARNKAQRQARKRHR